MSRENVEIVQERYHQLHESLERFLADMAPSFEYHTLSSEPDAGTYVGPDGFRKLASLWLEQFEDFRFEEDEFIDGGGHVIVSGRMTGKGHRSGLAIDAPYVFVWKVEDGMPVECREYATKAEAFEAVRLRE